MSDVIAKDNVRSVNSRQFIDFGGAIYQGNEDNLFAYIGAKETNSFSIIGQAVAGALEETSCVYDEPSVTTSLYKVSEKTLSTTDYLPGMNRTAWWGKVNEHGIGMAPLAVDRSTLDITENPTISVYKNYSSNRQAKPMKTAKMVDVNIYNGSEGVIYRAFIKDKNYPIKCIDIAVDKKHKNGTFNAFAEKSIIKALRV